MLFGNQITGKLLAEIIAAQHRPASSERDRLLLSQQQAPRNLSLNDQLRHYKPTEEQKAQALENMRNKRSLCVDYGDIVEQEMNERELKESFQPKQIEMPPLELNRSKSKIVNLFWDKLEGILPK